VKFTRKRLNFFARNDMVMAGDINSEQSVGVSGSYQGTHLGVPVGRLQKLCASGR
jgi:hypothetical protein